MTQTDTDMRFSPTGVSPTLSQSAAAKGDNQGAGAAGDTLAVAGIAATRDIGWKRATDLVLALALLLFFLPAFIVIAISLILQDGTPIIFSQKRIGKAGRTFSCLKFRSMAKDSEARLAQLLAASPERREEWEATQKLQDDPRIHPIGRILRRSSLDELPQLINVVRGDMSLVGPRPIVREEVAKYGANFDDYRSVRPGLTGLWQVSGRNSLSYDRRVELDVQYVDKLSFRADMAILMKTAVIVLLSRGDF